MGHNEAELLERARQLDDEALTEIYQALSPALYRYARRLLEDPLEAEETVAETFRRLLTAFSRGQGPREYLAAYLYRVLHNLITDRFRRRPPPDLPLEDELTDGAAGDPARSGAAQRLAARALLQQLTPEQRLVITLKYFEGLDNAEIAAVLEKPVGAVKALQHRGLEALRQALAREGWTAEGVWA